MADKRKRHAPGYKARVALEALSESRTTREIADRHGIHVNLVNSWKKKLKGASPQIFERNLKQDDKSKDAKLYEEIGRLKVDLDCLKKKFESVE